MKKIIALLLALVMVLSLCACGGSNEPPSTVPTDTKLTILKSDGTTEEMTFSDLKALGNENEAKYDKYYKGAPVLAVGIVESIDFEYIDGSLGYTLDSIKFADRCEVKLLHGKCEFLADLNKGDCVKVISNIASTASFVCLYGTHEGGSFTKDTFATTIVEKWDYDTAVDVNEVASKLALDKSLHSAIDELTFVSKYAGNTNASGSRAFAEEKISSIQCCLDDLNEEFISAKYPDLFSKLPELKENISSICDMLIDMGATNSDSNVATMKEMANDTIQVINDLMGY